jgi:ribosome-binding protein aMBF1 (putative translation factor)
MYRKEHVEMVGGSARSRAPKEFSADPQRWPEGDVADPAAAVVQHIARVLVREMDARGLSLRRVAATSGVNRQSIAELAAGLTWPDVQTVARIEDALAAQMYPNRYERG